MTCPRCNGTKVIDQWGHPCLDCQTQEEVTARCAHCKGTGGLQTSEDHHKMCHYCCRHGQGFYRLGDQYDEREGRWCCKRGCGTVFPATEEPPHDP